MFAERGDHTLVGSGQNPDTLAELGDLVGLISRLFLNQCQGRTLLAGVFFHTGDLYVVFADHIGQSHDFVALFFADIEQLVDVGLLNGHSLRQARNTLGHVGYIRSKTGNILGAVVLDVVREQVRTDDGEDQDADRAPDHVVVVEDALGFVSHFLLLGLVVDEHVVVFDLSFLEELGGGVVVVFDDSVFRLRGGFTFHDFSFLAFVGRVIGLVGRIGVVVDGGRGGHRNLLQMDCYHTPSHARDIPWAGT